MESGSPVVIPDHIRRLRDLAGDLWWSWNPQARELFRRLDTRLWRATLHNPIQMLRMIPVEAVFPGPVLLEMAVAFGHQVVLPPRAIDAACQERGDDAPDVVVRRLQTGGIRARDRRPETYEDMVAQLP